MDQLQIDVRHLHIIKLFLDAKSGQALYDKKQLPSRIRYLNKVRARNSREDQSKAAVSYPRATDDHPLLDRQALWAI